MKNLPKIPDIKFTDRNSADTNHVFVYEACPNPPFVRAIDGWKMVGQGRAPWPKSNSYFAVMFEKTTPADEKACSHRGEEMEEGSWIWHHLNEKWASLLED